MANPFMRSAIEGDLGRNIGFDAHREKQPDNFFQQAEQFTSSSWTYPENSEGAATAPLTPVCNGVPACTRSFPAMPQRMQVPSEPLALNTAFARMPLTPDGTIHTATPLNSNWTYSQPTSCPYERQYVDSSLMTPQRSTMAPGQNSWHRLSDQVHSPWTNRRETGHLPYDTQSSMHRVGEGPSSNANFPVIDAKLSATYTQDAVDHWHIMPEDREASVIAPIRPHQHHIAVSDPAGTLKSTPKEAVQITQCNFVHNGRRCKQPFSGKWRQGNLKRHQNTVHGVSKPVPCRFCYKGFARKDNAGKHERTCRRRPKS